MGYQIAPAASPPSTTTLAPSSPRALPVSCLLLQGLMGYEMRSAASPRSRTTWARSCVGVLAVLLIAQASAALAQTPDPRPHLKSLSPAGVRSYVTDSYGTIGLVLSNP